MASERAMKKATELTKMFGPWFVENKKRDKEINKIATALDEEWDEAVEACAKEADAEFKKLGNYEKGCCNYSVELCCEAIRQLKRGKA